MKKLFICYVVIIVSLPFQGVFAVERQSLALPVSKITEQGKEFLYKNLPWVPEDIEIYAENTPLRDISIPVPLTSLKIIPNWSGVPKLRGIVRLSFIVEVDGRECARFYHSFHIRLIRNVFITKKAIPKGMQITQDDLLEQKLDVTLLPYLPVKSWVDIQDKETARNLPESHILIPQDLVSPICVRQGELITIFINQGALNISVLGKAMKDGREGESVPVMNMDSNKVLLGHVTGKGKVKIAWRDK